MAFFEESAVSVGKPKPLLIPRCGACGLDKICRSPKTPVYGEGRKGILIVGAAPGEDGKHLEGKAGQYLRSVFQRFDVDLDRDCWLTNAIICRPPDSRSPTSDEVDFCRPNLTKAIKELKPRHIIPLGDSAVKSVLGSYWRSDVGTMTQWAGWKIPLQSENCWVTPTYHPSYVLGVGDESKGSYGKVVKVWFERHIENMLSCGGRPWEIVPDYKSQVHIVEDTDNAARIIRRIIQEGGAVSFDFETNRLKPDPSNAEIVTCAVCWRGKKTIAYPWAGEAIVATSELLQSDLPKIGANTKFETRWAYAKLGHGVTNWVWDCMTHAHLLDNRKGITNVEFQAFVRLGFAPWSDHITPYFESENPDGTNKIRELDRRALLIYNGIDAIVEFFVAVDQVAEKKRRLV